MARKKGNGDKDNISQTIVLITAILNLIQAIVDIVLKLIE